MSGRRAELFASDNLRVRFVSGFGRERLVVTFLPFNDPGNREEYGFGELFFEKRQIDAIHFMPADNSWYQYPELPEAAAAVRHIAAGYRRIITYGASMGGYAAIRFGSLVGAGEAVAISPQFSIDPQVAPFERRWPAEATAIDYSLERRLGPPFVDRAVIVYDPRNVDRTHVELYRPTTCIVDLPLVNVRHLATWILSDLGLLERLVLDVLAERLEPASFIAEARRRRRESSWFFIALADKSRHSQQRLALARRAGEMAPPDPVQLLTVATAHVELGQLARAAAALYRAHQQAPGGVQIRSYLAHVLELAGDLDGAAELLCELLAQHPTLAASYRAKADELAARRAAERLSLGTLRERLARAVPAAAAPTKRRWPGKLATWITGAPMRPAVPPAAPGEIVDLVLLGGGLMQGWEERFWHPFQVLNLGGADDAVEDVLQRLRSLQRPVAARVAIVMVGAANLRRGDRTDDIVAGIRTLGHELRARMPAAWRIALELPPAGTDDAEERRRRRLNAALRREPLFATIAIDAAAEWFAAGEAAAPSVRGQELVYRMLTRIVFERLDTALPPAGA